MKVKNIAIISFPLQDVGGINTWCENIIKGFNGMGVKSTTYHMTPGLRFKCDPVNKLRKSERADILPGLFLSYSDKELKNSLKVLNSYDAVLFLHPSPHPTRENNSKSGIENWKELYFKVKSKKVVIFHDNNWQKTNPWFIDVADHIDLIMCAQKKFTESVEQYKSPAVKFWNYFPMDLTMANKYTGMFPKEDFGMMATQWIKWKGHHHIIPQLPDIKTEIRFFNSGMEFFYLRKDGKLQEVIAKDHCRNEIWNKRSIHNYYGFMSYEELCKYYAKSRFSIDASVRGYTNYTHFEPMAFKSLSFVERRVFNDPHSVIPEDCCWVYDINDLNEAILRIKKDKVQAVKVALNARKFIQKFDQVEIAKDLVKRIEKL